MTEAGIGVTQLQAKDAKGCRIMGISGGQERAREGSPIGFRGRSPTDILISGVWPPDYERVNVCCLRLPSVWEFIWQPRMLTQMWRAG